MRTLSAALLILVAAGAAPAAAPEGYHLLKTVPVPGDGGWDYVSVDPEARRVYVSHATRVEVLDADSGEIKGQIADTAGVHGIAVAPDLGRGFTSNGRSDTVTVFDLKTLKPLGTVPTGKNPDAILYDPATHRVFAFNGRSASATVMDAADAKVAGTIDLGGQPESGAADGAGHVFVNLEDKGEVLKLDARDLKVLDRWPVAPARLPVSMAIDARNHRLFVGCRSKALLVLDTDSGKAVASLPIGDRVDAGAYDPETKLVFCSCGDGTVAVVRQETPDQYAVAETVKTRPGSKTMALDPKTHRLFLPGAEYKAAAAGAPRARPTPVPGSFVVMIFGR
ncbi:MAG TPA: YncE family protein [Gemmataceae bacterium]|jgi:YVTN family beta-propeller protein